MADRVTLGSQNRVRHFFMVFQASQVVSLKDAGLMYLNLIKETANRIMKMSQSKICYPLWHPDARYLSRYFLKNR